MTRTIGSLDVPAVGVGCNSFGTWADEAASRAVVDAAIDAGATFFDTADYYGDGASENILGEALAGRRDRVLVATKFGIFGRRPGRGRGDREFVFASLEASLRRLGTDHVDLYQMHFPDPDTPISETLGAVQELVTQGKVRELGVCNFSGGQVDEAVAAAREVGAPAIASAQSEWSLLRRGVESDLLPVCRRHGLAVIPYFPLASGLLTGKYDRSGQPPPGTRFAKAAFLAERYLNDRDLDTVDALAAFARERGRSLLELAVSWLAGQPEVGTVITGATRPEQVRANVAAAGWELDAEERTAVDRLTARP